MTGAFRVSYGGGIESLLGTVTLAGNSLFLNRHRRRVHAVEYFGKKLMSSIRGLALVCGHSVLLAGLTIPKIFVVTTRRLFLLLRTTSFSFG
jgi:hypothetical protein